MYGGRQLGLIPIRANGGSQSTEEVGSVLFPFAITEAYGIRRHTVYGGAGFGRYPVLYNGGPVYGGR